MVSVLKENWKEGETVDGNKRMWNPIYPANTANTSILYKTSFSLLLVSRWSVHTCDVGPEAGPEAEEEHQAGAQAGRGGPDGVGVQSLLTQPHHPDQN